jgi:hypothetical protein
MGRGTIGTSLLQLGCDDFLNEESRDQEFISLLIPELTHGLWTWTPELGLDSRFEPGLWTLAGPWSLELDPELRIIQGIGCTGEGKFGLTNDIQLTVQLYL